MDPDATLNAINDFIREGDVMAAREAMQDVVNYVDIGGYRPTAFYSTLDALIELERQVEDILNDV